MNGKPIIGVMGPGDASPEVIEFAVEIGRLIAEAGWITLSGGRPAGVMDAVSRGAKSGGGVTIGILPTRETEFISSYVDIPIITDMGNARNNINVLSSTVVIACGIGRGTASEIALALKSGKNVILLAASRAAVNFFREIGHDLISVAESPTEAIEFCRQLLEKLKTG